LGKAQGKNPGWEMGEQMIVESQVPFIVHARTPITVQTIAVTGTVPSYAAADQVNGMYFASDSGVVLQVKNTNRTTRVITITMPATGRGKKKVARTRVITIAARSDMIIGPFVIGGVVLVDFSAGPGVTVAAIKLPSSPTIG
jgi:hypothetical protein